MRQRPIAPGQRAPAEIRGLIAQGRSEIGRRIGLRHRLAAEFLHGSGIEIGPLHLPLLLPRGASVRYVDRMTTPELRRQYPELAGRRLVAPDIVADGERLAEIADGSLDFVVANHMIEHCEDPLRTLGNHRRVLRRGGIVYMAVPDGRRTFDRDRPATTLAHLLRDHADGPAWSRHAHFVEWARAVDGVPEGEVAHRAAQLESQDYSIHFHVFTPHSFLELVAVGTREHGLGLELETCAGTGHEFVVIMRAVG